MNKIDPVLRAHADKMLQDMHDFMNEFGYEEGLKQILIEHLRYVKMTKESYEQKPLVDKNGVTSDPVIHMIMYLGGHAE